MYQPGFTEYVSIICLMRVWNTSASCLGYRFGDGLLSPSLPHLLSGTLTKPGRMPRKETDRAEEQARKPEGESEPKRLWDFPSRIVLSGLRDPCWRSGSGSGMVVLFDTSLFSSVHR